MKKIILALAAIFTIMAVSLTEANAQSKGPERVTKTYTTTNVDTANLAFNSIASGVKSFQITLVKNSGTVAGKVYIEATDDGIGWFRLDSLVTADVAGPQFQKTPFTSTSYNSYRARYITTGTQSSTLYFTVVRRPDEK